MLVPNKNQFTADSDLRVVLSGVDILYIGYYGKIKEKVLNQLEEAKASAQERGRTIGNMHSSGVEESLGEYTFNVSQYGESPYAYVLSNGSLRVKISQKDLSVNFPNVYVKINSHYILELGVDKAVEKVRKLVEEEIYEELYYEKVSKVEMYCDIVGAELSLSDIDKFVSRARSDTIYRENRNFTGFTFGKGDIKAKVYLKTEEIKRSHKEYMYEAWEDVEEGEPVWRIEFELKRKVLKEYGIESYEEFKGKSGDLWKYLTSEWLSEREFDNENTTRRTLTSLWKVVCSVRDFFGRITGAVRDRKRSCEVEHLLRMAAGLSTSIGAKLEEISFKKVLEIIIRYMKKKFAGTEEVIEELVEKGFAREVIRKAVMCG